MIQPPFPCTSKICDQPAPVTDTLLCDMGGTHVRLAWATTSKSEIRPFTDFCKYRLDSRNSFAEIFEHFFTRTGKEAQHAFFSLAREPENGIIKYRRQVGDPDYIINFNTLAQTFGWTHWNTFNDLEAAACGLSATREEDCLTLLPAEAECRNGHRLLVSVGTGVGHAGLLKNGLVLKTYGGHFPLALGKPVHQKIADTISRTCDDRPLLAEDFISFRGLQQIDTLLGGTKTIDVAEVEFYQHLQAGSATLTAYGELLGTYLHCLTGATGFYGGIYLTGGVIDTLIKYDLLATDAIKSFLRPAGVPVVVAALKGCPLYYVKTKELPLRGLALMATGSA